MARILVIEDSALIREHTSEVLEFEGFTVIQAENGRVGLKLAQELLPDLMICDIMMPELDGYGVLTELRMQPDTAAIPFIFLTAKADRESCQDRRKNPLLGDLIPIITLGKIAEQ